MKLHFTSTMVRRTFLKHALSATCTAGIYVCSQSASTSYSTHVESDSISTRKIQTVLGVIDSSELGLTLPHEHVMCDFIGADKVSKERYDPNEVFEVVLPYLQEISALGVTGFVDCTPMYIGRDAGILARLSKATGMHILTNTGLYKEPFLPKYAFEWSTDQLAQLWIKEIEEGIENTKIKAGFIKIAVNPGTLIPIQQKIVRAAAKTSLATGATIASHTGRGIAALEEIDIVQQEKVAPENLIIVHADSEQEQKYHLEIAKRGAWVEYDGIGPNSAERHIGLIRDIVDAGYEDKLLLSQDAGWYTVGEVRGGQVRSYAYLIKEFIPLMRKNGFDEKLIQKLTVTNPALAFAMD